MRQIYKSTVIVVVALILALWAMYPLDTKLRKGKDLAGGVSLVYAVQIGPNEDSKETLAKMIDVLKRRVDPNGLMEISMTAQGRDRIEISMPLPNDEVKGLKRTFEEGLAELGRANLTSARIDETMKLAPAERDAALTALGAGSTGRLDLLKRAATAYDDAAAKRAAYSPATDPTLAGAKAVAEAEIAYERARGTALAMALSADEIRTVIQSSTQERRIVDGKDVVLLPSQRTLAEERLRASHPDSKVDIDRIFALHDAYALRRTTLDDPQDLKRMLRGAGVLTFRIACDPAEHPQEEALRTQFRELGPGNSRAPDARWYKINQIESWINTKTDAENLAADPEYAVPFFRNQGYVVEPHAGDFYMLCWDTRGTRLTPAEGSWSVTTARPGTDEIGRPSIDFAMSTTGSVLLGALTRAHVGDKMAVMLDDQVYTAPTLNSEISSQGQIEGDFPREEIDYIVRVLTGGSLAAKLSPEPISENSVGPELGADNLQKGLRAGIYSVFIVAGFMIAYYFGFGVIAVVALLVNSLLIIGAMALSKAAFTMPGIAGLILTFGMAVDSNVLIYERMREELLRGADLKSAVRLGFDRALASIVDGNITNLIVCVVLYYTGTPEIRGFAITMGIGVLATLFSALVVSRLIFDVLVAAGWRRASMLPMAIPAIQRALTPAVNWMRLRWVFAAVAAVYVTIGLAMVFYQGRKMLDNEFLGGTQITLQFRDGPDGQPLTMERADVAARVAEIADAVGPENELRQLSFAEVFPVDPRDDGVTSDQFIIKTVAGKDNPGAVTTAVVNKFADMIEAKPPLAFGGSTLATGRELPVYPIDKPFLGENIDRPGVRFDSKPYLGGAAIVLDGITPPVSLENLRERLTSTRAGSVYSDTLSRKTEIVVLDGTEDAVRSAAIVVRDESVSYFENEAGWESEVRQREWNLVREALTQAATPASVQNFSATIASSFRADAITATLVSFFFIGIYIWVRFKTPRYAIAALVALVHDVITVVGLLALAEILYETPATHGFAVALGLLPFKIDLNTVAALLTIAGYSLNDTVVVMDRIRENRGKLAHATSSIINNSINQTFSRTVITGGTTLGSCFILYIVGGEGMKPFAFALMTGLVVGTYSSFAVAAPIVWSRKYDREFAALGGHS